MVSTLPPEAPLPQLREKNLFDIGSPKITVVKQMVTIRHRLLLRESLREAAAEFQPAAGGAIRAVSAL
jgi:hypothetical protein